MQLIFVTLCSPYQHNRSIVFETNKWLILIDVYKPVFCTYFAQKNVHLATECNNIQFPSQGSVSQFQIFQDSYFVISHSIFCITICSSLVVAGFRKVSLTETTEFRCAGDSRSDLTFDSLHSARYGSHQPVHCRTSGRSSELS